MYASLRILGLWLMVAPAIFGHSHHKDLAKLQAKFAHEKDPVDKAKLMVKLERAEFEQIEADLEKNRLKEAVDGLRQYKGQADSVSKSLDATGRNAAKHGAGFMQLQISLREALRRLNNILVGLTGDEQKPFVHIRDHLDLLNRHLMLELFPSQPK